MKYAYSSLKSTATNFVVLQSKHFARPSFSFISFISPVNFYLFKVNNRSTRKRCKICSELTIKTTERHHWLSSGVFIVNFERISHPFLEFLCFTLNKLTLAGSPSLFKHSNVANGIIFNFVFQWKIYSFKIVSNLWSSFLVIDCFLHLF